MSKLERFIRAITGEYPRPVSRREYVKLLCDNAALTSAIEQKERARAAAVEESRRLQRALDDAHRVIEAQRASLARFEMTYRVCYINGQGYSYIDSFGWEAIPLAARARVRVLALCQSEAAARLIAKSLPSAWRDDVTYYNPQTNETQWVVSEVKR